MQIGSKRAINGHLAKLGKAIDKRIQYWAAFAEQGGMKDARARLLEAQEIQALIEGTRYAMGKKEDSDE